MYVYYGSLMHTYSHGIALTSLYVLDGCHTTGSRSHRPLLLHKTVYGHILFRPKTEELKTLEENILYNFKIEMS
jgi:hypothetical protein